MLNVESYLADLSHKKGAFLLLVDLLHRLNKPDLNYSSAKAEHIQLTTLAQFIVASGDLKIRNKIDSLRTTEIEEIELTI